MEQKPVTDDAQEEQSKKFSEGYEKLKELAKEAIEADNANLFLRFPWSPKYLRYVELMTKSILGENFSKFMILHVAISQKHGSLGKIVRRHEEHIAETQAKKQAMYISFSSFVFLFLYLNSVLVLPFFIPFLFAIEIKLWLQLLWLLPSAIISTIILYRTLFSSGSASRGNRIIVFPLSMILVECLLVLAIVRIPNSLIVYLLLTPLLGHALGVVSIFFAFFSSYFLADLRIERDKSKKPISYLLHEYLEALSNFRKTYLEAPNAFENNNDAAFDFQDRKNVSEHLIESTRIISRYLSKALKSKDIALNYLSDRSIARILAGTRSLAFSVMVSKESEIKNVREKIENNFIAIATENLGDLFAAEPEKRSVQNTLGPLSNAIRAVVIGMLPLSGIWLGMKFGLLGNEANLHAYILLSIGWLVWQLVTLIEPEINQKIADFKEALNSIPGIGGK